MHQLLGVDGDHSAQKEVCVLPAASTGCASSRPAATIPAATVDATLFSFAARVLRDRGGAQREMDLTADAGARTRSALEVGHTEADIILFVFCVTGGRNMVKHSYVHITAMFSSWQVLPQQDFCPNIFRLQVPVAMHALNTHVHNNRFRCRHYRTFWKGSCEAQRARAIHNVWSLKNSIGNRCLLQLALNRCSLMTYTLEDPRTTHTRTHTTAPADKQTIAVCWESPIERSVIFLYFSEMRSQTLQHVRMPTTIR